MPGKGKSIEALKKMHKDAKDSKKVQIKKKEKKDKTKKGQKKKIPHYQTKEDEPMHCSICYVPTNPKQSAYRRSCHLRNHLLTIHKIGSLTDSSPQDKYMMRKKEPRQVKCQKCEAFDSVYRISRNTHVCKNSKTLVKNPFYKQKEKKETDKEQYMSEEEDDVEEVTLSSDEENETQETEMQETETQETETHETETQETEAQETEMQETETQETEAQETEMQETETQETETQETETQETETQDTELFTFMIHLSPEEMAQVQDNIGEMTLADYLEWDPGATLVDNDTDTQTYLLQTPTVKIYLNFELKFKTC
jgi:hypothetical protein